MKIYTLPGLILLSYLFVSSVSPAKAYDSNSELLDAASRGDSSRVVRALDQGANLEAKTEAGVTPLIWAAVNGHVAVVSLLIQRGANVNSRTASGGTALKGAALKGHLDVVRLLLEKSVDLNAEDNQGQTALDAARDAGQREVVAFLESVMREAVSNEGQPSPGSASHSSGRNAQSESSFNSLEETDSSSPGGLRGLQIQNFNESLARSRGSIETKGAFVSEVVSGSPAEKAGIQSGDIIVAYNGSAIALIGSAAQLKALLQREGAGEVVMLLVSRHGITSWVAVRD